MGEALFIILGKSITNKVSPLAISTGVSVIGVLLFFPMAIYEWATSHYSFGAVNDWLLILYFGIVVTVFAFLLMYHGLEKLPASTVGILTSVLPLSTVILSFIFLKESLHPYHLIGSFLIMIAIYFTSREENSKRNKELK
jgi:drug/metabolite transporter (DMT)-like permease